MPWKGDRNDTESYEDANDSTYELLLPNESSTSRLFKSIPDHLPWYRRSTYMLFGASIFLFISAILYTVDVVSSHSPDHVSSSNSYLNSIISHLWPVGNANRTDNWENENSKTMHALFGCMANSGCSENQTSVVLLSSPHFAGSIAGDVSGEDIWATSILLSLKQMGYSAIYAPSNYELARTYRQYPDLVKIIIIDASEAKSCFEDSTCIKTKNHPLGIPVWKMLSFHFWTGAKHPLGSKWTLSPENYPLINPGSSKDNVYLGYSIEHACKEIPITPIKERPNQGYVYGKRLDYFSGEFYAWDGISLVPPFPIKLVAGFHNATVFPSPPPPEGIQNLGFLSKHKFYEELGKSRVLVGIGLPYLSPTPYDALCMGVPFVNPVLKWDKKDPENRAKWEAQHDGLKYEDPPYVYNVKKGDKDGLWKAVKDALDHPIDRYIPLNMTMASLNFRLGDIIQRDWKSQAEVLHIHVAVRNLRYQQGEIHTCL